MPLIADQGRYIDLSQIDFEALREKFEGSRKSIEVQKLRAKLTFKLARMIQVNRTRIDFLEPCKVPWLQRLEIAGGIILSIKLRLRAERTRRVTERLAIGGIRP